VRRGLTRWSDEIVLASLAHGGTIAAGRSPKPRRLRHALQRNDWQMLSALVVAYHGFQTRARLGPDLRLRRGAGRPAGPAGPGLEAPPAGGGRTRTCQRNRE